MHAHYPAMSHFTIPTVKLRLHLEARFYPAASPSALKHLAYEIILYCNISDIPHIWSHILGHMRPVVTGEAEREKGEAEREKKAAMRADGWG